MAQLNRIVLYGTLQRREPGFERLGLARALRFVGPCRVVGRLIDLGEYPGFLAGNDIVVGQLWEIADPAILPVLDAFEDYRPGAPKRSLYIREPVPLVEPAGEAMIYRYNGGTDDGPTIPSGDWITHSTRR